VHTLYARDDGGKIELWTPVAHHRPGNMDRILGGIGPFVMHRVEIDVAGRSVSLAPVPGGESFQTEFPRIRDDRIGRRVSWGFSGLQSEELDFDFRGILKWDFERNRLAGAVRFPDGAVGGEPVFMPARGGGGGDDDDGYIGMLLWHSATRETTFALFDARTMSDAPVAELLVPRHVPLGFHAAWVGEAEFQTQLRAAGALEIRAEADRRSTPASCL